LLRDHGKANPVRNSIMPRQISVEQLKAIVDRGEPICLIDVRQPWEHDTAALPDSVLMPLDQLIAHADEIAPPGGAAVVVYCHHGIRSLSGAALLEQMGFAEVYSLAGGIDAWSRLVDPSVPRY
jgi:adenylyltransferase/sulfurtransferase